MKIQNLKCTVTKKSAMAYG